MNIRNNAIKLVALAVLPAALSTNSFAQSAEYTPSAALVFKNSTDRETWHNIMIVSAVVLFAGLLGNNDTLTTLGGAGVILSLVETNGNSFRYRSTPNLEMMHFGQMSLGVSPFDQMKLSQGIVSARPSFVLQTKIRF